MSDWNGDKDYLLRKGLSEQRERPTGSAQSKAKKPVLLEYYVEPYQTGWWNPRSGWVKQGRYNSRGQALRLIESAQKPGRSRWTYRAPEGCKWRIDGVEVEGA